MQTGNSPLFLQSPSCQQQQSSPHILLPQPRVPAHQQQQMQTQNYFLPQVPADVKVDPKRNSSPEQMQIHKLLTSKNPEETRKVFLQECQQGYCIIYNHKN